ncbi:MAG: hypothetical protein [Caudoviricetes sp.]|nr:MAG: hypothetical protein [Caudoviricetes sp.]
MELNFSNLHGHSDKSSNLRFLDSTIKVDEMLDFARDNDYNAISFTGHESLSDHISAERLYHSKPEYYDNFKLVLGNEIYLVDRDEMNKAEEEGLKSEDFKFTHFLINALDKKGHEFLQKQSTLAWKHEHMYHGQDRVPSYYDEIENLMKDYKGHVIASTACLGGEFARLITKFVETNDSDYMQRAKKFINWCIRVFGKDNFKLELMPSKDKKQLDVNEYAIVISKYLDIDYIITTDAHYVNKAQRSVHTALLRSRDKARDLSAYDTAHLFTYDELLGYFEPDVLNKGIENIQKIVDRVEDYKFEHTPDVPKPKIPDFELHGYGISTKYENIVNYFKADNNYDKYLLSLSLDALKEIGKIDDDTYLSRLDLELGELSAISKTLKQPLSSYFLVMREFINIMWETSVVGPGRGSSSCYLINYLLGITQVDAIKFELPYYRFLSKERVTKNTASQFPDIDTDTSSSQRENVIELIKENRGRDHVLNFCTFSTIATRSAILTACRGLDIDNNEANYITSLLPTDDSGKELPITVAINGDKDNEPDKKLNEEIEKYDNLKETILGLFGLVIGFSEHASGVYISNPEYTKHNAMMRTKNGIEVTQFDADDSEYASALKYDFLSLDGCDRLQAVIELLLKEKKIEWQGSLHETYQKYFDTDDLDYTSQDMYDMLFNGDIINAFQFSSETGYKTLRKLNARTFEDLISGNALMRLRAAEGEQPLDKYIRFKNDNTAWGAEMDEYGLNKSEQATLHALLDQYNGICSSQELLMQLSMEIAGFDLVQANALRKAIAKKDPVKQAKQHEIFVEEGIKNGKRKEFLEYCWKNCIEIQKGYAFSLPHAIPYTMILITEMNICKRFGLLYWQTACLNVNAKTLSDEIQNPDYAKVAKAIGMLKKGTVIHPDINKSELYFVPDEHKSTILFGLNAINGLGKNEIQAILDLRPFNSMDDFIERMSECASQAKIITMIKAGLLNELTNQSRRVTMIDYLNKTVKPKSRIVITSAHKFKDLIPKEYHDMINAYEYKKLLKDGNLNHKQTIVFIRNITTMIEDFEKRECKSYDDDLWKTTKDDKIKVDMKRFDKWLKDFTQPLKDWLKTDAGLQAECRYRKREFWIENCLGNEASWDMDALNMYVGEHELVLAGLTPEEGYHSFNELDEVPKPTGIKKYRGREYPQYENFRICGTVIDKNNNKGIAVLLTSDGVANVRVGRKRYSEYNKRIMKEVDGKRQCVDESWFDRGTKLVAVGHRIQNDFVLSTNGTGFTSNLGKLTVSEGSVFTTFNKEK